MLCGQALKFGLDISFFTIGDGINNNNKQKQNEYLLMTQFIYVKIMRTNSHTSYLT